MKILMYSNSFGGHTPTFIMQDVDHLSKKHTLLYLCNTILNTSSSHYDNVKVIKANPMSLMQRALWKYDIRLSYKNTHFGKRLNHAIEKFSPDLIHCQFGIEALRLIDNITNYSIPVVIQFRGFDASKMLKKKSYVRRLRDLLDKENVYSIFVSESLRENLKAHQINVNNSMILHSGIDLTKFIRETDKKRDIFTFLQVSSLVEKKGHEYTLEAFARFLSNQRSKNYRLILTGDGKRKEQLIQLVKKLNIGEYVEFTGFVSPQEAKILMQNADIFLHHSITPQDGDQEGIPNALMEAMAMELPVISTYHSGIPELVNDGINGYLVKERDITTYTKRMADITEWNKLKVNREVITKEFEIGKHITKLESFYFKMIEASISR